jgi:endonuclease G
VKRFSLLLLLIVASLSLGVTSPDLKNVTINNSVYTIVYSQDFEQPLEITYDVECTSKSKEYYSRKGLNFYKPDGIHTSDDADYYNNVWDKGHMAPAADFNCNLSSLKSTFSYVNCALQHQDLNRGQWKALEAYEKELAINNEVTIKIYVDFVGSTRLKTGAMLPVGFSKVIYLNGNRFKSYYFPNRRLEGSYEKYLISKN